MKLSELKNGAVVEIRNGERFLKVDNTFLDLNMNGLYMPADIYNENLRYPRNSDYDIVAVNNSVKNNRGYLNGALYDVYKRNKWTWEEPKSILTDKEKEYLKAVCKPFEVEYIRKIKGYFVDSVGECIAIDINNYYFNSCHDSICLPYFEENTMYKGMEVDRVYTPKELEIY